MSTKETQAELDEKDGKAVVSEGVAETNVKPAEEAAVETPVAEKPAEEAAATTEEPAPAVKLFKLELPEASRGSFRAARKLEGVVLESVDGLNVVTYPETHRAAVVEAAKDHFSNGDVTIHESAADSGNSLYGVLHRAGFADSIDPMVTIFEAAVNERVNAREAEFDKRVDAKVLLAVESLQDDVDTLVAEGVTRWIEENKVAIDTGIRLQNAEKFIGSIKTALESVGVEIPEDKVDAVAALEAKVAELEGNLKTVTESRDELQVEIDAGRLATAVDEAADKYSLSDAKKSRLIELVTDLGIAKGLEKIDSICEAFLGEGKVAKPEKTETVEKKPETVTEDINGVKPAPAKPKVDPAIIAMRRMRFGA